MWEQPPTSWNSTYLYMMYNLVKTKLSQWHGMNFEGCYQFVSITALVCQCLLGMLGHSWLGTTLACDFYWQVVESCPSALFVTYNTSAWGSCLIESDLPFFVKPGIGGCSRNLDRVAKSMSLLHSLNACVVCRVVSISERGGVKGSPAFLKEQNKTQYHIVSQRIPPAFKWGQPVTCCAPVLVRLFVRARE